MTQNSLKWILALSLALSYSLECCRDSFRAITQITSSRAPAGAKSQKYILFFVTLGEGGDQTQFNECFIF